MDPRLTTTHGTLRACIAAVVALALLVTLGATSASAAKATTCSVANTDTGRTYIRLQQAVDAAKPGAHLVVKGTCHGGTFIDKDLVIVGTKTKRAGESDLTGGNKARVLVIKQGVKVHIRGLTIRKGKATRIRNGGGIANKGTLSLRDVVVRGSEASLGGGIYNEGVLRVTGRSVVKRNSSGVHNVGHLILGGASRIYRNDDCGVHNGGDFVMNGKSTVTGNEPLIGRLTAGSAIWAA